MEKTKMAQPAVSKKEVVVFAGKRVRYQSALSFDEVLGKLRSSMGKITLADVLDPSRSLEDFEKRVKEHEGPSGFMLFVEMDHGSWMQKFGVKRRVVRWIFGNPLIAITMLRHDYTAGLFVPVDLLLAEGDGGVGCNITYVLPSSLIAVEQNAPLLAAAQALDAKVEALVSAAVAR
jgi:uncharacterized protein (DUF302 family)